MKIVLIVVVAIFAISILSSVVIFLGLWTLLRMKQIVGRARFIGLTKKLLNLDPIEEWQHQEPRDYQALLLRKWQERDHLLRWRIVRSCDAIAEKVEYLTEEEKRRIAHDPDAVIVGDIWRRWGFTARFPFLRVKKVETLTTILLYSGNNFTIPNLPVELVRDIIDMRDLGFIIRIR